MNDPKLDEAASQLKLFPTWLRMQYPATVGNIHCQKMEEQIDNILTALSSLQVENDKLKTEIIDSITREGKAQAECDKLREDKEMLKSALNVIPASRLELLADWIDADDATKGRNGGEVQQDLRKMAVLSRAATTKGTQ